MRKPIAFIAEDHEVMGMGLRALLEAEFEVYGPHADGAQVAAMVSRVRPELLVLDLSLPNANGMYLIEQVRKLSPETKIIVHTMFADHDLMEEARRRGAHGYVGKDAGAQELLRGIAALTEGDTYFSPLIRRPSKRPRVDGPHGVAIAQLTDRRQLILRLIGEGLTTEEIARELGVTERTIYWHRSQIRQGLGVESEEDLTRVAVLWRQAMRVAEAEADPGSRTP